MCYYVYSLTLLFQPVVIDAPVLVQLDTGTIRYRYKEGEEEDPGDRKNRIELPHEGPERAKKHGYFFHATLNDFSEGISSINVLH